MASELRLPAASASRYYFDLCEKVGLKGSEPLSELNPEDLGKAVARFTLTFFIQPTIGSLGTLYNFGLALIKAGLGAAAWASDAEINGVSAEAYGKRALKHVAFGSCDYLTKSVPLVSALIHTFWPDKIEVLYKAVEDLFDNRQLAAVQP